MNLFNQSLNDFERSLRDQFEPNFLELKRLHNGLISLKLVSDNFSGINDKHQHFHEQLSKQGRRLPEGLLLFLYAPEDLDDEELAALEYNFRGTPTWADALLLEPKQEPTDQRKELDGKQVVTFWGVKGGVGRTTALAHVAAILGKRGKKILAVDLDLDSPALVAKLCTPEVAATARLDQLLATFYSTEDLDARQTAISNALVVNEDQLQYRINLLGQGFADAAFVTSLSGPLLPSSLYRNQPLLRQIIALAADQVGADLILIDARSGFCEESAVGLLDLADIAFVFASPSPSNFKSLQPGIEAMERSRLNLGHPQAIHFVASMLPAGKDARGMVITELNEVILEAYQRLKIDCNLTEEQLPAETPHIEIHYEPVIVENENQLFLDQVNGFAEIADRILPPQTLAQNGIDEQWVKQVLEEVKIPIPQAEDDQIETLASIYTRTAEIGQFINPNISLVLGAKGTGKTFLKRLCLEKPELIAKDITFLDGFAPLRRENPNAPLRGNELLRKISRDLSGFWSEAFSVFAMAVVYKSLKRINAHALDKIFNRDLRQHLEQLIGDSTQAEQWAVIKHLIQDALTLDDTWGKINTELKQQMITLCLVFDDLDVALGERSSDLTERNTMISGLFDRMNISWLNRRQIQTKIFLREDIFRSLNLEEEAKYTSRRVTLAWRGEDLWRLLTRALAVGSPTYLAHLENSNLSLDQLEHAPFSEWSMALKLIWGERLGKSEGDTRTVVWAARRLSDGKSRFFPRAALWLLDQAIIEQKQRGAPPAPPIIQAPALRASMATVAKERFAELERECSDDEKSMLYLLHGMKAYQNQAKFLDSLRSAIQVQKLPLDANEVLNKLVSLGIVEEGQRRNKTPTIRIVDLYAFNPDLEITREGRR